MTILFAEKSLACERGAWDMWDRGNTSAVSSFVAAFGLGTSAFSFLVGLPFPFAPFSFSSALAFIFTLAFILALALVFALGMALRA